MKTILATTYAVNPYKGSEDAMGWNYVTQIARFNKVVAVTRENNQADIERYMADNPSEEYKNMTFLYFDLPYWMRFWKRGGRGALVYFYMWQMAIPSFIKRVGLDFDIAHNLNFHNDWTPTFLWRLEHPLVWGPVGHHPAIPKAFVKEIYGTKDYVIDRLRWAVKQAFWKCGYFLKKGARRSDRVIGMNSSVDKVLQLKKDQIITVNSVCSEMHSDGRLPSDKFTAIFVGRFVPLKGADVAINAFAEFYHKLNENQRKQLDFVMIGKGPSEPLLRSLIDKHHLQHVIRIISWMDRADLKTYYQKSSVFLFPSHEGAGMVVPEALSYGLPVLAFDNIGPGEFIDDTCGRKIPYANYADSVSAFADALYMMYSDPEGLSELSKGARAHYELKFTWEKRGELLASIYDDVLAEAEPKM